MPSLVIRRFADRLDKMSGHIEQEAEFALTAGSLLSEVLDNTHLLELSEREPDPHRYRQHVLHVDPRGRFSVVALVWLPGQVTPIHDHIAWCVAGVFTGQEHERRYIQQSAESGKIILAESETVLNSSGEVSVLTAGPDIHQVSCASERKTISLHVYGADISKAGSSISTTYSEKAVGYPASVTR